MLFIQYCAHRLYSPASLAAGRGQDRLSGDLQVHQPQTHGEHSQRPGPPLTPHVVLTAHHVAFAAPISVTVYFGLFLCRFCTYVVDQAHQHAGHQVLLR